ncbi:MAG TPA: hypothetical protein DDZ60_11655 [Planktothrix sp. UBA10369]|jgi:hypothetical protein|nr:hypothetical protein [Planktothrix sp. UBA8402]HBK23127.1 hypothetical protein [Planktothrix sp. UBA10369]
MKYQIAKCFKKNLDRINNQKILAKVRKCIEAIGTSQSLSEIPDLEDRLLMRSQPKPNVLVCYNYGIIR